MVAPRPAMELAGERNRSKDRTVGQSVNWGFQTPAQAARMLAATTLPTKDNSTVSEIDTIQPSERALQKMDYGALLDKG